jgi:hypothetical protein
VEPDGTVSTLYPAAGPARFYAFNDMISLTSNGDWTFFTQGTSAGHSVVAPVSGGIGWVQASTGTTATGRASIWSPSTAVLRLGLGAATFGARFRVPTLSTATDTYTLRCGFIDANTLESVDGVLFRYSHGVNGGRFEAVTRSNSTETAVDTGVTVATGTDYVTHIAVNAAGTSAQFIINGTVVATITTNIPTGSGRETGYGIYGQKSVGTASIALYTVDYLRVEMWFSGR